MNKERRLQIKNVVDQLNNLKDEIENIKADEEEYKDNMPEFVRTLEKGDGIDLSIL